MACDTSKFVINKGMSNEFIITIKQNDSTLPMVIDNTDTFVAKLFELESNTLKITTNATVNDAANGQIMITLSESEVDGLIAERGDKVDGYYLIPTYRLAIDCNTVNNGRFVAKISEVYVEA